jgi:hypothetical protein
MLVRKRDELRQSSRSRALCIRNVIFAVFLCPISAWGWGNDGHEIVAIIAADNLTQAAQSHVASILGVQADRIATAMEAASVRPDSEFREEDRSTAPGTSSIYVCKTGESTFPRDAPAVTASPVKSTNIRNASKRGATTDGALPVIWRS